MNIDLLKKALSYAGHKSICDAIQPMWHKGPCDCGWEAVDAELQKVGLTPLTKKCQHCGSIVAERDFSRMDTCIKCNDHLCERCILLGDCGTGKHVGSPPARQSCACDGALDDGCFHCSPNEWACPDCKWPLVLATGQSDSKRVCLRCKGRELSPAKWIEVSFSGRA